MSDRFTPKFTTFGASSSRNAPGPSTARDDSLERGGGGGGRASRKFDPQIFPTKPATCLDKAGTEGTKIELTANYFPIKQKPGSEIHEYSVKVEPTVDDKKTRLRLIASVKERIGSYIYSGANILYTFQRINETSTQFEWQAELESKRYVLLIDHRGKIDLTSGEALQVMNILLRRAMKGLELQSVGRHLFDAKSAVNTQNGFQLWPGYITSVRHHEQEMLLCCEIAHRVMRKETAYELLKKLKNAGGDFMTEFSKQIVGTTVLTSYNNRTYRIDSIAPKGTKPTTTFTKKDGTEQSIFDYYMSKHHIEIKDKDQPMLVSKPSKFDQRDNRDETILLVPELCRLTGITPEMRSNFNTMRDLASHTQLKPKARIDALRKFANSLKTMPKCHDVLLNANFKVNQDLVSFTGRQLSFEKILFGDGKTFQCDEKVDWQNQFRNSELFNNVELNNWAAIFPGSLADATRNFVKSMQKVAYNMKFVISDPTSRVQVDGRPNPNAKSYADAINKVLAEKKPQLIFVVIQNLTADIYQAVKKLTCVQNAIPSQVVLGKNISKNNMSVATKVVIQLNCKIGGAPWMVSYPLRNTMTVGFDVTHDTKDKKISYGAFVATMDLVKEVKFYSAVIKHTGGEEMSTNLCKTLGNAIECYVKRHGVLPDKLFFYRDGVGDGQVEHVHQVELNDIKTLLNDLKRKHNAKDALKLTFVIVNKRINTRIFFNGDNPKPGTIADNTITLPERYDFYLVSQSTRIGTVTPTSYNVIEDEVALSPGKLQMLTYKNCHLYYNWSGTVRVPAVVQYAHKLAFLVGQYIHDVPISEMGELGSLYFL